MTGQVAAARRLRDRETVDAFLQAIRSGHGIETAAEFAKVPARTVKRWQQRGRDAETAAEDNDAPIAPDDLEYVEFVRELTKARADAVVRLGTIINRAAGPQPLLDRTGRPIYDASGNLMTTGGDWKAAAWWLERTHPEQFSQHSRTELTGAGGGPIETFTQIDLQVGMEHAAHPQRTAAIAAALADAGLLALPIGTEAIETTATDDTDS